MYYFKRTIALFFCIALLFYLAACQSHVSSEKLDEIYDRLELVDEFYERSSPLHEQDYSVHYKDGTFRGVAFGTERSSVMNTETLPVLEEYDNAIDYLPTLVFNYSMTPTYWFNSYDEFYRGSYFMTVEEDIRDISAKITGMLSGLYGQPYDVNYYDSDDNIVYESDVDNIIRLVNEEGVYYYAGFYYDIIYVELIIEAGEAGKSLQKYDVYIYYTDYSYKY